MKRKPSFSQNPNYEGWTSVLEYIAKKYARVLGYFSNCDKILREPGQYKGEMIGYKKGKNMIIFYSWDGYEWKRIERKIIKL